MPGRQPDGQPEHSQREREAVEARLRGRAYIDYTLRPYRPMSMRQMTYLDNRPAAPKVFAKDLVRHIRGVSFCLLSYTAATLFANLPGLVVLVRRLSVQVCDQ
jgi:hypothetical protein